MSAIKSDQHVKDVCRPGTVECCRYLCMGSMGWECAKHTSLQTVIDTRANSGQMRAIGDNCDGPPSVEQTIH